jgi:aryl-alcohol dehydrogenase-like predicted oxidoreductase
MSGPLDGKGGSMEYRTLGRTGLRVGALSLGAMMLAPTGNPDEAECRRIFDRALDAGVNLIDTADVYSGGESERIVGRALKGRRDNVLISSKFHFPMDDRPNHGGNSRHWILQACEDSLRRLDTDHIDLYQAHRPDDSVALEETIAALTDLVVAGKIRYFGTSCFQASGIVEALWHADHQGLRRIASEQLSYSLLARGAELDVLPTCTRHGLGVLVWSPLAGGWLTGGWRAESGAGPSTRAERLPQRYDLSLRHNQRKLAAVEQLAQLAESAGIPLVHLALAWVQSNSSVSSVLIGPRTMEHAESHLAAAGLQLDSDLLARIDEIVEPAMNFALTDVGFAPTS